MTPPELDIRLSIGVDFGRFLIVGNNDFFGEPVNVASKLGEDIAKPGEILITERTMQHIDQNLGFEFDLTERKVSGVDTRIYKVRYYQDAPR